MARVSTLEGSRRACLAVRRNKAGNCTCATYGPPGSGPGFVGLCKQHNLPVVVGSTHLHGGSHMGKNRSVDFPPVDGLDGIGGFLGQLLPTPEQFKESLLVAGGAAGAMLLGSFVLPKLLPSTWSPLVRAAVVLGIAIVGGGFAFRFSPQLAVGIIGGLGGLAVATAIGGLADMPVSLGFLGEGEEEADDAAAALEDMPEERELLGPPSTTVDPVQPWQVGDAEVETAQPFGAVPVGTWL